MSTKIRFRMGRKIVDEVKDAKGRVVDHVFAPQPWVEVDAIGHTSIAEPLSLYDLETLVIQGHRLTHAMGVNKSVALSMAHRLMSESVLQADPSERRMLERMAQVAYAIHNLEAGRVVHDDLMEQRLGLSPASRQVELKPWRVHYYLQPVPLNPAKKPPRPKDAIEGLAYDLKWARGYEQDPTMYNTAIEAASREDAWVSARHRFPEWRIVEINPLGWSEEKPRAKFVPRPAEPEVQPVVPKQEPTVHKVGELPNDLVEQIKSAQHGQSQMEVKVHSVEAIREHPEADRLTIVSIAGMELVANKKEDGSYRYAPGDLAVYLPENAVLPEWLLKRLDLWDEAKGKGILAGSKGNRVKMRRFAGVESRGALLKVEKQFWPEVDREALLVWNEGTDTGLEVKEGDDVREFLGVFEYIPQ